MRVAIIDLGTNSVRFDIHQFGPKNASHVLYREKVMVRLGQDVFVKGQLDKQAISRTTQAFLAFKRISRELSVNRIIALGTSALREAVDGPHFIANLRKATGIEVRLISGTEEARLIAQGVLNNEKLARGRIALVDIGGGSTEISVVRNKKVVHCESFPLGTARLQQVFLKKSPPKAKSVDDLRHFIQKVLAEKIVLDEWPQVADAIGSSGTIKALAKIQRKMTGKKHLTREGLDALVRKMARMTTTQLLGLPGVEAKRVDMILAGGILLQECLETLGAKRVFPTDFSLRDGILAEQLELLKKQMGSPIALHLPDLIEKAKKFGVNGKNLAEVLKNADFLFDRLRSLHRLAPEWKVYLLAAVALRNTGEAVSLVGHPEHSYYIVKNAKFPFIEDWESEFVALLCRYHEQHKLDLRALPFEGERKRRQEFLLCLGILSITDALDSGSGVTAVIRKVTLRKGSVKVYFSKGSLSDLELFRAERRKALFEQIFRRGLALERI